MEFFRLKRDIPFMSYARSTTVVSAIMFVLAVFFLVTRGLHFGVDFTGGTVMEVNYGGAADIQKTRETWARIGLSDASVQNFGSSHTLLIRLPVKQGITGAK